MAEKNAFEMAMEAPHESKFKKYGKMLKTNLTKMRSAKSGEKKPLLHWYQMEAVIQTWNLVMRDEQTEIESFSQSQGNSKPIVIVAPTGSGKSGMIVMLPYILESNRVLILTPSKIISEQLGVSFGPSHKSKCFFETSGLCEDYKLLKNFLERVQIISCAEDITRTHELGNLVIVNAQKFGGKSRTSLVYKNEDIIDDVENFFASFDTLIVDEAHHYPAATWKKIVDEFNKPSNLPKKIIFLTATPYRSNKQGEKVFVLGPGEKALERIAFEISPQRIEGTTTRIAKFVEAGHALTVENLAVDISRILNEHARNETRFIPQAMVLVRTMKEAKDLTMKLNRILKNDKFATAVLAENSSKKKRSSDGTRLTPLEEFTNGNVRVAFTCGVATVGYDNTKVTLCVILRKIVEGRVLFAQFVGRCKRMQRGLNGRTPDRSVSTVFSYPEFEQKKMWDEMDQLAENDPIDDDEVE